AGRIGLQSLSAAIGTGYRTPTRNGTTSELGFVSPISSRVRFATASAAASNTASAAWTYRDVTERPACPTSAAIVDSEKPRSPASEAKLWRKTCGVMSVGNSPSFAIFGQYFL